MDSKIKISLSRTIVRLFGDISDLKKSLEADFQSSFKWGIPEQIFSKNCLLKEYKKVQTILNDAENNYEAIKNLKNTIDLMTQTLLSGDQIKSSSIQSSNLAYSLGRQAFSEILPEIQRIVSHLYEDLEKEIK
jgi:hypothetical protein